MLAVERLQVFDWHALDVAAVADGRFAVVVPFIGDGGHALAQNVLRVVFPHLEFVADDRHFREQVLALDIAVDQAVCFQADAELEVGFGGGHGFEIVRAIDPGGAVEVSAVVAEGLGNVLVLRRALEKHVLEQVGHAGFAVALVPRPDQDREVHGDGRGGLVGE